MITRGSRLIIGLALASFLVGCGESSGPPAQTAPAPVAQPGDATKANDPLSSAMPPMPK